MSSLPKAASWMLDATQLRQSLDRLSDLLDRPQVPRSDDTIPLPFSRHSLHDSVSQVLDAVSRVDASSYRTVAAVGIGYRPASEAEQLRKFVESLRGSWARRVRDGLGPAKTACLVELLRSPAPDFLGIINQRRNENMNSDVLACLLDPRRSPEFAPNILRALVGHLDDSEKWPARVAAAIGGGVLSVRRECVTGREGDGDAQGLDRVDLLVSGPGFDLVIENKVFSSEHGRQTVRYWEWMQSFRGGLSSEERLLGGVFLSPSGRIPCCANFKPLSYLDLVNCLLEGPTRSDVPAESERVLLSSYLKTLASGVLNTELRAAGVRGETA